MAISVNATTENKSVTEARNGVLQIQIWFNDPETAVETQLHSGTGFLINDNTVVTCQHVATGFSKEFYADWAHSTGRTAEEVKQKLELRVSVLRDVYIKATIKTASTEMDYAVLVLDESIKNRTPLSLRDSSTLSQTEEVHALGFPGELNDIATTNYYDPTDVTITSGNVNKISNMSFYTSSGNLYSNVNCVESSALVTGGNSGGPLVDANGNVVGINAVRSDTRNIAVSSKQLIDVLDALGIKYTSSNASSKPAVSDDANVDVEKVDTSKLSNLLATANEKEAENYTEASFKALKTAIKTANSAINSDSQIDIDNAVAELKAAINSLEKIETSSTDKYVLIGIIAAVAVIIIAFVIILIVALSKKNKAPVEMSSVPKAPAVASHSPNASIPPQARQSVTVPPVMSAPVQMPVSNATAVLNHGSGETTVLNQSAGETTVLSQTVNGGSLMRLSNNERIPINSADFTIGRERSKVDYCVGGNTNISRIHACFVVKDGKTYIVDNKAANGTFVNGIKARAGQEIELNNGDKILLADERFEFNK